MRREKWEMNVCEREREKCEKCSEWSIKLMRSLKIAHLCPKHKVQAVSLLSETTPPSPQKQFSKITKIEPRSLCLFINTIPG